MDAAEPKAVQPGEGRRLGVLGNVFTLKVAAVATNDAYSVFEIESPPNGGIPPHINTREAETHIIVQSRYSFLMGTRTHEAGPGAIFFVPRGTPHAFQNVGPGPGRVLLIPSPGSNNEALVVKLADKFGSGLPPSGPDPKLLEAVATLAREHGVEASLPPG